MKHVTVVIDWYGPYSSIPEARKAARNDYGDGLYMAVGKIKHQRGYKKLQYIGLSSTLAVRLSNGHKKLKLVSQKFELWMGEVGSTGIPGKKAQVTNVQLDLAEWAHSYFLELPLNNKKRRKPPKHPVTVLNRWWQSDYETKWRKRPHRDWPDIIDFWGVDYGARLGWFGSKSGGRCEVWSDSDF